MRAATPPLWTRMRRAPGSEPCAPIQLSHALTLESSHRPPIHAQTARLRSQRPPGPGEAPAHRAASHNTQNICCRRRPGGRPAGGLWGSAPLSGLGACALPSDAATPFHNCG
jgi:hypothetical protein